MILPHSLCPDSEIFWPFEVRGVYRVSGQIPSPRSQVPGPRSQVPGPRYRVPGPRSFGFPFAFLQRSFSFP